MKPVVCVPNAGRQKIRKGGALTLAIRLARSSARWVAETKEPKSWPAMMMGNTPASMQAESHMFHRIRLRGTRLAKA